MTTDKTSTRQSFLERATAFAVTPRAILLGLVFGAIGLPFALFGVYAFFYQETKTTELSVALYRADDALAQSFDGGGAKILVAGAVVDPSITPLRAVLVRVWNSGDFPIRREDFDQQAPFGFRVNGKVLRLDVSYASTPYLQEAAALKIGDKQVFIGPFTLEPGESVLVRAMVQFEDVRSANIEPFGKVAGMRQVTQRLTHWHPEGFVDGYPTVAEQRVRGWVIAGVLVMLIGLFVWSAVLSLRARFAKPKS